MSSTSSLNAQRSEKPSLRSLIARLYSNKCTLSAIVMSDAFPLLIAQYRSNRVNARAIYWINTRTEENYPQQLCRLTFPRCSVFPRED